MCTLFVLFCFSDRNTPRPCSTDTIGSRHHFTYPAAPQEQTLALLLRRPWWGYREGPSKSAPASDAWYGQEGEALVEGKVGTFREAAKEDRRPVSRCVGVSSTANTFADGGITVGGVLAEEAAAASTVPETATIVAGEVSFLPKIAALRGRQCRHGLV